uniref:Protein SON n=1 Tax=Culex pipiens TaxID=7175 RepID=A0A8D8GCT3_CULPI
MYMTSAQHKKMYSGGGGNRNSSYQQQQQYNSNQRNNQTPAVGSDYGYGGGMNHNFTQGSDSSSFGMSSMLSGTDSGYSGNVPFYMLQSSSYTSSGGNGNNGGGAGNSNYSYNYNHNTNSNYNSNSNYSGGGNYSQSQYSAAYQTQGYQNNSDDSGNNLRKQGGWVKKDSLKRATPYSGAKGTNMLQKMGWNPGQSLGRRQNGQLEPHMPDIKTNRRGFGVSTQKVFVPTGQGDKKKAQIGPQPVKSINLVTEGKNPISILEEYSTKRKLQPPRYETVVDEGPVHDKTFVFKVIVDGVDYPADKGGKKKKDAKAEAARQCLVKLGVLAKPTEV